MWCREIGVGPLIGRLHPETSRPFYRTGLGLTDKIARQFLGMQLDRWSDFTTGTTAWHSFFRERLGLGTAEPDSRGRLSHPAVAALFAGALASLPEAHITYLRLLHQMETAGALLFNEIEAHCIGTDYTVNGTCLTRPDRLADVDLAALETFVSGQGQTRATIVQTMRAAATIDADAVRVADALDDIDRGVGASNLFQQVGSVHSYQAVGIVIQSPPLLLTLGMPGTAITTLLQYPDQLGSIDALYIKPPRQLEGALAAAGCNRFSRLCSLRLRAREEFGEEEMLGDDKALTLAAGLAMAPWISNLRLLNLKGQPISERAQRQVKRTLPTHLTILFGEDAESSSGQGYL